MAQAHKFKSLDDLTSVFPEIPWKASGGGTVWVFDSKADEYVEVTKGQYVVSIGDRFEVSDEEPSNAKPADAKDESAGAKPHASEVEGGIKGPATQTNENTK